MSSLMASNRTTTFPSGLGFLSNRLRCVIILRMSIFSELQTLINEHGSSNILRERLSLLAERIAILEYQLTEVTKERDAKDAENATLKQRIAHYESEAEFVKSDGVLWKARPDGTYEQCPYCPKCHSVMHQHPPGLAKAAYWVCLPCQTKVHCLHARQPAPQQ